MTPAERLVWWSVSLLPSDVRGRAQDELRAAGLRPDEPAATAAEPAGELADRLRSTRTVLGGDAVLASGRPDWAGLAAEHRREPFGRAQRRVLIAHPDCPDALVGALLTPWDSLVASRLATRSGPVPRWVWRASLERIGEVRPSLLRRVLSRETAEELILTTPRLDLLVRTVDGYDHNHHEPAQAFWDGAGRLLRRRLGTEPSAWVAAAAALPSHPGTIAGLLRRAGHERTAAPADADLRVLAQAPGTVLNGTIAALPDLVLASMWERDLRPRRAREHLTSVILDRLIAAGVPPRAVFARWAYGARHSAAARAWAHGLNPLLDQVNERTAEYDVTLRRLLAAGSPPRHAATGIAGVLRAPGPVEAEALLMAAFGENGSPPWGELVGAHLDAPLPPHLLCVLAARDGFPEALARALPADRLGLVAGQSPAAARAAVTALHRFPHPTGVLARVHATRVLDDEELLARSRPAREVLQRAFGPYAPEPGGGHENGLLGHYLRLVSAASRSAPPGFWPALLRLLPAFEGTLPELLTAAGAPPDDR